MPYGDGASFSGFRKDPWPVPGTNQTLMFRGIKNFDATLNYAFENLGLKTATDMVVTGGSAGGLSTFLHTDRVANAMKKNAPNLKQIRGAPIVGFFLDHDNFKHTWNTYTEEMKYIYSMQNLTSGSGALNEECLETYYNNPHYCFMSPHMQKFIKTPFFMFNSKYDAWQIGNEIQISSWKTKAEQNAILQYGVDFMKQFESVASENQNGAFITSCICHGCPWNSLKLGSQNLTSMEHYSRWNKGLAGWNSIHVDFSLPNGAGKLQGGVYKQCKTFR